MLPLAFRQSQTNVLGPASQISWSCGEISTAGFVEKTFVLPRAGPPVTENGCEKKSLFHGLQWASLPGMAMPMIPKLVCAVRNWLNLSNRVDGARASMTYW